MMMISWYLTHLGQNSLLSSYLGTQLDGVRSTSQVANSFIGTGRVPVAGAFTHFSAMVGSSTRGQNTSERDRRSDVSVLGRGCLHDGAVDHMNVRGASLSADVVTMHQSPEGLSATAGGINRLKDSTMRRRTPTNRNGTDAKDVRDEYRRQAE